MYFSFPAVVFISLLISLCFASPPLTLLSLPESTGYDYLDEFLAREYCVLCQPFMCAEECWKFSDILRDLRRN